MKFIPAPQDWLKTLWLFPACTLWSVVGGGLNNLLLRVNEETPIPTLLLISGIFSTLVFPILSTAFLHHLLWGKSKSRLWSWLPKWASWRESLWLWWAALSGILIFFLTVLIIGLFYVGFVYSVGKLLGLPQSELGRATARTLINAIENEGFSEETGWLAMGLWIYCAAMVFRCQRLRKNRHHTADS